LAQSPGRFLSSLLGFWYEEFERKVCELQALFNRTPNPDCAWNVAAIMIDRFEHFWREREVDIHHAL
jgi:hypothetical protein